MPIPTELVGSLPRPMKLLEAYADLDDDKITFEQLQAEQDVAAEDSIKRLEQTGETYVTDGEQRESSFATYPITDTLAGTGLADNLAGDGQFFAIFDDGHHRQLPRLTGGPFKYKTFASESVEKNKAIATKPVKQAVISLHSKEVPYDKLLNHMFDINAGYFLIQCSSEEDKEAVYKLCGENSKDDQVCFMGASTHSAPRSRPPSRSTTTSCWRRSTSPSSASVPTTAVSRRSAAT